MIWWPRYVGDWKNGTSALTPMQKGVYGELLDYCYSKESPLPLQFEMICRIAGATTAVEQRAVEVVINLFFVKTPDGYINERAAKEISEWKDKSAKASKSAKTMWAKRRARGD